MRRIRLLLASQPLAEGVPRHVLDLVDSLDPDRYVLDVACPEGSMLWDGVAGRSHVTRHAMSAARGPSPADARTLRTLAQLARRADLVHGHSSKAGFLARLAATLRGRRRACIFTPHGWSFWSAGGFASDVYVRVERLAAHWCEAILAVSRHERDAGLAAGVGHERQYHVISNGVDLARFEAEPVPVPGRVLFVGRLAGQKRPDVAVRAFAEARRTAPSAELWIAGDGPQRPAVERLAAELGLRDAVRLLGARRDVPELLRGSQCLLLSSDYEGCPLTVIEAMAAGVPVVATAVGGVPELVIAGETGLLAPSGDPSRLAAELRTVLSSPELSLRLGTCGRERARREHSRERMAAQTASIYEAVLDRAGS